MTSKMILTNKIILLKIPNMSMLEMNWRKSY